MTIPTGLLVLLCLVAGCRRAPPPAPAAPTPAGSLAVGSLFACALRDQGQVRCWGDSDSGSLGVAGLTHVDPYGPGTDVDVGGRVVRLAAGIRACAVLDTGTLRCWGSNKFGELGYRHRRNVFVPSAEGDIAVGGRVLEVALGSNHTCALLEGGEVRCWGEHVPAKIREGQTPAELPRIALGEDARSVVAWGWESCALLASNRIRCWGDSTLYGQRYSASGPFLDADPGEPVESLVLRRGLYAVTKAGTLLRFGEVAGGFERQPTVAFDAKLLKLAAGDKVLCGLLEGGRVRCWGRNLQAGVDLGLLGVPGLTEQNLESPVGRDVDLGGPAVAVAAGDLMNCALRADGRVLCWGMVDTGKPVGKNTRIVGAKETPAAFGTVRVFENAGPQRAP